MFSEVTLYFEVAIPATDLGSKEPIHQRNLLATRLLKYLLNIKSTEKHGYYLTVTRFKQTGEERTDESHPCNVLFPVSLTCRTFRPCVGEAMLGVVFKVFEVGVMLRCGPMRVVFLSVRKMAGFRYVPGEKAVFFDNSLSRIEEGIVVRVRVLDVRWVENGECDLKREFIALASLEGDSLGPVSLSGSDELELW